MTSYVPRSAWTDHPAPDGLAPLPATVRGVAVHWTGGAGYGPRATLEQSCARLEGFRRFHTDPVPAGRGWSDFAYNVAFDVEGRVFDGRGLRRMSAANGNRQVNSSHAAVLFLLGKGDRPTEAMLAAFADWRRDRWLPAWPRAVEVVGHRDLSGTDCPGPVLYPLVRSGRLAQPVTPTPDWRILCDSTPTTWRRSPTSCCRPPRVPRAPGTRSRTAWIRPPVTRC